MAESSAVVAHVGPSESFVCQAWMPYTHAGKYELEWIDKANCPSAQTTNKDGTTGWVTVIRSTNSYYGEGNNFKIHLCAHNPCRAHWNNSKYGHPGPPVHMQRITELGPESALLLPITAAPIAEASEITTAEVPLLPLTKHPCAQPSVTMTAAKRRLARDKIQDTGIALARDIRQPNKYIGYVAFVLFALRYKCRPCYWEGSTKHSFLDTYCRWALDTLCLHECPFAAIACGLQENSDGYTECVQISDDCPLTKLVHYVAAVDLGNAHLWSDSVVLPEGSAFANFYMACGVHYVPTVCDGDCGMDVMCLMLGRPRTKHERTQLRADLSDYLLDSLKYDWMIDILLVTCEIEPEDVNVARSKLDSEEALL